MVMMHNEAVDAEAEEEDGAQFMHVRKGSIKGRMDKRWISAPRGL